MIKVVSIIFMFSLLCYSKDEQKQVEEKMVAADSEIIMKQWKGKEYIAQRWIKNMISGLENAKAKYREKFNREPPVWEWRIVKVTRSLNNAIKIDAPYPMKEEKEAMRSKFESVKAEYKKRFGEPITDFELSAERVYFKSEGLTPGSFIFIIRTATGAIVKYRPHGWDIDGILELELGMEEWLDFIRALYKCCIDRWEGFYDSPTLDGTQWSLEIFSLDKNKPYEFAGHNAYPPNWDEFEKIINGITTIMKRNAKNDMDKKLKAEYRKKFGKDISDFELGVNYVYFNDESGTNSANRSGYTFFVNKSLAGRIRAIYRPPEGSFEADLDISEWLDFVNAIYRCRISEWNMEHYKVADIEKEWHLAVNLDNGEKYEFLSYRNYTYPPNWDKVKKAMDDMTVIIKKRGKK